MKLSFLNKLLLINRSYTMKKLVLLVILAFSLVLSPLTSMATTPKLINYQGKLKNLPAQSGPFLVVFEIFEDAAGGTALWIEQKNVTPSTDGTFSTYLGETNPIDLKFDKQYYVQITVGNNQPFPRTKLTSAPSAFYAADADTATYAFESGLAMDVAPEAIGLDNLAPEVLTAGGDLMGMYPNPQIRPDAILDNIPDGSITTEMLSPNISTSPSGPAGGDMTGTYPDPLIAVGAVKTDRIADGAVTNEKIADMTIMDAKIINLDAAKLFNLAALTGMVAVATDATIDGDGTNAMPLGLADDAVTSAKILDGEVMTADLMDDAVTNEKLADDAVMSANIVDGQVMNADLAVDAVMSVNIMDGQVMTADLMDDAVTNAKLADDAVMVENIAVNNVVGPVDGDFLSWDAVDGAMRWAGPTVFTTAPITGDGTSADPVTLDPQFGGINDLLIRDAAGWTAGLIDSDNIAENAITPFQLADDAVMTNHIMDGQVMTADLMDGAVNSAKILDESIMTIDLMDASVTGVKIADDAIMTNHIVDGQVMTADLMDLGVTTIKVANMAITTDKLADNSVTTIKIADGEVMTADIADVNVTEAKLADNAVSTRTIETNAVTEPKMADNSVSTRTIQDVAVTTAKIADDAVTTAKLFNGAVTNLKIADLAVTNEKVSSQGQPQGKIMKADGFGGVSWEDDEGIILPWIGSYDGPGDAFTLTHTGISGDGSAAVFNSAAAANDSAAVEIIKDVADGTGSALQVHGIGVQGQNYIATFTNENLNEGRTVLMENDAPTQLPLIDPMTPLDPADDYVAPDPTGTDVEDATLVLRNNDGAASGQKLALKTYGSIQANSAIQGTDLIAHDGEVIINNGTINGGALFINENSMEKISDPLAVTEDFQMFNTGGDFDLNLDGHLDVRNQAWIGDGVDENQTTVRGALTAVTIDLSNPGVPNVSPAGPGTATTVPTANADLLVNGDAELTGSLNLGGSADTYNSVNDIYISTDLTTLTPALPAPPTTVIFESNDAQLISARAVEDALLSHDLQVAYNNGNSITSTDGQGDIDFNLEEATDFTITGANVGNDVIIDGAGYLDAQVNIINTSAGNAVIVEDDLEPDADDTYNLGSDVNRWSNAYVNGGSVHVGPTGGFAGNTELAVGYAANAATFTVDGAVVTTMDALNDVITLDPNGDAANEVTVDAANDQIWLNADADANIDVTVDPTGAGILLDGNSSGTPNFHVNGTVALTDADGDGTNDVTVDPTGAGILLDGNSSGTPNFHVNGAVALIDADGNGTNNFTADGTTVDLDPNGDATTNFSFASTGATISTGGAGDVVLSDAGVAANGATQTFAFTNGGAGDLDVSLDGALTGLNSGHALGTIGTNANVLNVDGAITPLPLAATDYELTVNGDALVTGTLTVGSLDPDRVVVTNAAGNMVTDDDYTYNETTNVLNIQGTIVNNTGDVTVNDNLIPGTPATNTLGTDAVRWKDLFVDGASVHIGTAIGTELLVGYAANAATFGVDASTNLELDQANQQIDLDPNGDGNLMARFDEQASIIDFDVNGAATAEVSISAGGITVDGDNAGVSTNALYSETGLNRNGGATETYAFANTGGVLDVDISGNIDVASANSTFGDGLNATQASINGVATPTTTNVNGTIATSPAAADHELVVTGDAQITGALTLGSAGNENSVDDIFTSLDLTATFLFPDPSNDDELVTARAVQQALLNHTLQVAYNNGNQIVATDAELDIDFDLTENTDFTVNLATANNQLLVDGLGIANIQTVIQASDDDIVEVDDNLLVNEDFDIRGDIYNEAGVNATPVTITDDVTMTMQDGDDNVEITAATTNDNLFVVTKTAGNNNAAVLVNTNVNGINVLNPANAAAAIGYNTTLDGDNAIAFNADMNGATGTGLSADVGGGIGADIAVSTGTGVNVVASNSGDGVASEVTTGIAVQAEASTGRAITATNDVNDDSAPTVTMSNNNTGSDAYALAVTNGHARVSIDANGNVQNIALNGASIAITSSTIKRCTTGGANRSNLDIPAGSQEGQILVITNEDGGDMSFTTGTLANYTIPAQQATQFVFAGGVWVALSN